MTPLTSAIIVTNAIARPATLRTNDAKIIEEIK